MSGVAVAVVVLSALVSANCGSAGLDEAADEVAASCAATRAGEAAKMSVSSEIANVR